MLPVVRKMPEPMTLPMTSSVAPQRPMPAVERGIGVGDGRKRTAESGTVPGLYHVRPGQHPML